MKIARVTIHNFRSIHDAALDQYDYTMLVGANNSGKSNIIQALRIFYEDASWAASDAPRIPGQDKESWIELRYSLSREEFASLPDKYKGKDPFLTVRKYFAAEKEERVKKGQTVA